MDSRSTRACADTKKFACVRRKFASVRRQFSKNLSNPGEYLLEFARWSLLEFAELQLSSGDHKFEFVRCKFFTGSLAANLSRRQKLK